MSFYSPSMLSRHLCSLHHWVRYLKPLSQNEQSHYRWHAARVKSFECAVNLSFVIMSNYLHALGWDLDAPRQILKAAYAQGLLPHEELWLDMLEDRNRFAHIYDEDQMLSASTVIEKNYEPAISAFIEIIQAK